MVFEAVLGARACYLIYSVIYDGSLITDDTRSVDRNDFIFVGGFGLFYHYYKLFSIRATFQTSTDLLVEESIPEPEPGETKTSANISYGFIHYRLLFLVITSANKLQAVIMFTFIESSRYQFLRTCRKGNL